MPETSGAVNDQDIQVVIFSIGNEEFGVDIYQVKEIIRQTRITHMPKAPSFVEGIINLRGQVVIVLDLSKRLDLPIKEYDEHARIIIVENDKTMVGMIVTSVSEAFRFSKSSFETTPSIVNTQIQQEFIRGVAKLPEGRLLIILDLLKILTDQEYAQLEHVGQNAGALGASEV